ncbi:MAG: pyridoxal phosphate-dependent aminotransferase [Phycisphaeraceae bacterium]|nr:pyridoxal phosphate-dependent aminotransferase [Phycisphaeraceae bacterium]
MPSTHPGLSHRVTALKPSVTIAVAARAREMARQGIEVIGFTLGEPDFDTPVLAKQAAISALMAGQTKYMATLGDLETRGVIAEKLTRENGIPGLTAEHVAISAGGKQALYVLFHCLIDEPRDGEPAAEVLLPTPTWVSYGPIAEMAGARIVTLPTSREQGFLIEPDRLRAAINERTRAIVLCTPSNPCGTMYPESHLREIASVVGEAARTTAPDLLLVVDEIYEKVVYGKTPHFSVGSIPEIAERTVTVNGLSKAYAMTGWRAGYAACSGAFGLRLINAMGTLQGQISTNMTSFVYPAIRAALTQCGESVETMRRAFAGRAEVICGLLEGMDRLVLRRPDGAIYAFPDVSGCFGLRSPGGREIRSSLDFAEALLAEHHVAVIPGEDFGPPGERHVRISFACSEDQIRRGMSRVGEFVESLR